jgi:hypothetical protein
MSATLIGTVGIWGIASAETVVIIEGLDDVSSNQKNYIKDRVGCRTGRSDYDESIKITVRGKVPATGGFSAKLQGALVLSNTIPATHLIGSGTGRTLIDEVSKTRQNEDWQGITIEAEMLPFFPGA